MSADLLGQFLDAAARNTPCTLALPAAGVVISRRSRLLGCDAQGLWVQVDPLDLNLLTRLRVSGTPLRVVVRHGSSDLHAVVRIISYTATYTLTDRNMLPAICVERPASVESTRRRAEFRVTVGPQDALTIRVWKINEYVLVRDRPPPSQELKAELQELSMSGMKIKVYARGAEALRLAADTRLRIELNVANQELVFEGRIRHPVATGRDDESAVIGVRLVRSDRDIEARRANSVLARVLGEMQRLAVKAQRLTA